MASQMSFPEKMVDQLPRRYTGVTAIHKVSVEGVAAVVVDAAIGQTSKAANRKVNAVVGIANYRTVIVNASRIENTVAVINKESRIELHELTRRLCLSVGRPHDQHEEDQTENCGAHAPDTMLRRL